VDGRLQQMRKEGWEDGAKAAEDALNAVKSAKHPSRALIHRLVLDETAWETLHRHWKKLVDNDAKWEDLAARLAKEGGDKVEAHLRTVFGLTPGAATAVLAVLARISSEQRVAGTSYFVDGNVLLPGAFCDGDRVSVRQVF